MPCPMPLQPWHVICDHVGRAGLSRAVAYPVERRCRSPRTAGLLKRNDSPKRSFLTTKTVVSRAKRSKHRFSETKCERIAKRFSYKSFSAKDKNRFVRCFVALRRDRFVSVSLLRGETRNETVSAALARLLCAPLSCCSCRVRLMPMPSQQLACWLGAEFLYLHVFVRFFCLQPEAISGIERGTPSLGRKVAGCAVGRPNRVG